MKYLELILLHVEQMIDKLNSKPAHNLIKSSYKFQKNK